MVLPGYEPDGREIRRDMVKKGKKSGEMDEEDTLLWQEVLKTVRPYRKAGKSPPGPKKEKAGKDKAVPPKAPSLPSFTPAPPKTAAQKPAPQKPAKGFDRSTEARLKGGRLPIEGRIDLHGMTQEKAHGALMAFVRRALKDGKRTLLVITGKGDAQKNTGILRRLLPMWLEESEFSRDVLALAQAQPKDGGGGAFYLRLRRKRG